LDSRSKRSAFPRASHREEEEMVGEEMVVEEMVVEEVVEECPRETSFPTKAAIRGRGLQLAK
tara:strand:- start:315 stop:500 length:186 start_codon:yes stop_codon:yes gene_type:complete